MADRRVRRSGGRVNGLDERLDGVVEALLDAGVDGWRCEACGCVFVGDHWSMADCNETGDGVQLCQTCAVAGEVDGAVARLRERCGPFAGRVFEAVLLDIDDSAEFDIDVGRIAERLRCLQTSIRCALESLRVACSNHGEILALEILTRGMPEGGWLAAEVLS